MQRLDAVFVAGENELGAEQLLLVLLAFAHCCWHCCIICSLRHALKGGIHTGVIGQAKGDMPQGFITIAFSAGLDGAEWMEDSGTGKNGHFVGAAAMMIFRYKHLLSML